MSSGKVHSSISVGASVGVSVALIISSAVNNDAYLWAVPLGVLSGVLLTPDLDQDKTVMSHRYSNMLFGRVFGLWWYYLWHSYSIAFKHRSKSSHWPILSTVIRLIFLLFPPIIILFRNQQKTGLLSLLFYCIASMIAVAPIWIAIFFLYQSTVSIDVSLIVYFIIGLIISDTLHYIMDMI